MTITYPTWTAAIGLALVWFFSSRPPWLVALLCAVLLLCLTSDLLHRESRGSR